MNLEDVIFPSSRDRMFGLSELSDKVFGYLEPSSVKAFALVSK